MNTMKNQIEAEQMKRKRHTNASKFTQALVSTEKEKQSKRGRRASVTIDMNTGAEALLLTLVTMRKACIA